jgi:cell division protein FtsB
VKWFLASLAALLLLLQYRVWLSSDGVREVWKLRGAVSAQQAENERLSERNRQLAAEVRDLKQGYAALEERARTDLGMIGSNETFFQTLPREPAAVPAQPGAPSSGPGGGTQAESPGSGSAQRSSPILARGAP